MMVENPRQLDGRLHWNPLSVVRRGARLASVTEADEASHPREDRTRRQGWGMTKRSTTHRCGTVPFLPHPA